MLGIGRRVGSVTYREIVGDTTQWKKEHIDEIMAMFHPNKRQIVKDLARFYRVHRTTLSFGWAASGRKNLNSSVNTGGTSPA